MSRALRRAALSALCPIVLAASPSSAGQVWIVGDVATGAHVERLQRAINAAADGDVILVRELSGPLEKVLVKSKSLSIIAMPCPGKPRPAIDRLTIRLLADSQRVVVRGLEVRPPPGLFTPAGSGQVVVDAALGVVRLEDCHVVGGTTTVIGSKAVVFESCTLRGQEGHGAQGTDPCGAAGGSTGLAVGHSQVVVRDCFVKGGDGGHFNDKPGAYCTLGDCYDSSSYEPVGQSAAPGLAVGSSSQLFVSGSTFVGGSIACPEPAVVGNPGSPVFLLDSVLEDGQGGSPAPVSSGDLIWLPGPDRGLELASPVFEGLSAEAVLTGAPGELALLLVGTEPVQRWIPSWEGLLSVASSTVVPVGALGDPSGTASLLISAPPLAPGIEASETWLQSLLVDPADLSVTSGASHTLVDVAAPLALQGVSPGECDCNGNGQHDVLDLSSGASVDCDGDGLPDECDTSTDCDGDGLHDSCAIEQGLVPDCDLDGIPDGCDVTLGIGFDCDGDGILDSCEIAAGTQIDCDGDGNPDPCQLASDPSADCDGNGIPDACDITAGTQIDCDGDGNPDPCQLAADPSLDCDGNGVLDACQIDDCNGNGVPDACDLASGLLQDLDGDGLPDSCVLLSEEFEGGLGAWTLALHPVLSTAPSLWHAAGAGECGLVSGAAAYGHGPPACDYGEPQLTAGRLLSPPVSFGQSAPGKLLFVSTLDPGAVTTGPVGSVVLEETTGPLKTVLASTLQLSAGAGPTAFELPIPAGASWLGKEARVVFEVIALPTTAPTGQGWVVDEVRLVSGP